MKARTLSKSKWFYETLFYGLAKGKLFLDLERARVAAQTKGQQRERKWEA